MKSPIDEPWKEMNPKRISIPKRLSKDKQWILSVMVCVFRVNIRCKVFGNNQLNKHFLDVWRQRFMAREFL
jgi:hypothetical protein